MPLLQHQQVGPRNPTLASKKKKIEPQNKYHLVIPSGCGKYVENRVIYWNIVVYWDLMEYLMGYFMEI